MIFNIKTLDKGFFEYIGPHGIIRVTNIINEFLNIKNKGFIFQYLNIFALGIISYFYIII